MVDNVAEGVVIPRCGLIVVILGRNVGFPDDGAPGIWEPPHPHKVTLCPQTLVPLAEHDLIRVDGLRPLQAVSGHGLEFNLDDNAQRAKGNQRGAEELVVFGARACPHGTVGGDDLEFYNRLADEAVEKRASVRAGRDDAGGGLLVDGSEVRHGEAHAVELLAKLPQSDAGLEVNDVGALVMAEDLAQAIQVDEP